MQVLADNVLTGNVGLFYSVCMHMIFLGQTYEPLGLNSIKYGNSYNGTPSKVVVREAQKQKMMAVMNMLHMIHETLSLYLSHNLILFKVKGK